MPALIALTAVIQAFFVLHVFRTRRPYWWAVVITATPVVGCLVYYFIEVFPRSREFRGAQRMSAQVATAFVPHVELRRRLTDLQLCPSVSNKVAAAEELMRCGMYYRAVCLYEEALRVVMEMGKASTSTLQRRLRLGYGRAARILDMMYRDGIIGPPDGSKPREVLKSPEWLREVDHV